MSVRIITDTGRSDISHLLQTATRGVTRTMPTPEDLSEISRRALSVNVVVMKVTHHVPANLTQRHLPGAKIAPARGQRGSSSANSFLVIRPQLQPHLALHCTGITRRLHREQSPNTSTHMLQMTPDGEVTVEAARGVDQAVEGVAPSDKDLTVALACIGLTAGQLQERRLLNDTHRCLRNTFHQDGCQFTSDDTSYEIFFLICFQDIRHLFIPSGHFSHLSFPRTDCSHLTSGCTSPRQWSPMARPEKRDQILLI